MTPADIQELNVILLRAMTKKNKNDKLIQSREIIAQLEKRKSN